MFEFTFQLFKNINMSFIGGQMINKIHRKKFQFNLINKKRRKNFRFNDEKYNKVIFNFSCLFKFVINDNCQYR